MSMLILQATKTLVLIKPGKTLVLQRQGPVVVLSRAGAPGPAGTGAGYTHTQSSPSTLWAINHNLGYNPVVGVRSVGGVELEAEIIHLSLNVCTVGFNTATAGSARLT